MSEQLARDSLESVRARRRAVAQRHAAHARHVSHLEAVTKPETEPEIEPLPPLPGARAAEPEPDLQPEPKPYPLPLRPPEIEREVEAEPEPPRYPLPPRPPDVEPEPIPKIGPAPAHLAGVLDIESPERVAPTRSTRRSRRRARTQRPVTPPIPVEQRHPAHLADPPGALVADTALHVAAPPVVPTTRYKVPWRTRMRSAALLVVLTGVLGVVTTVLVLAAVFLVVQALAGL